MKVSIIIPIYKVADYIVDCLESVYNQSYNDIEIVLINDCTPDNSMEVASPYILKLRERFEVKIINHKNNRGLSAARNSGIKMSSGDWLFFLDSDDLIVRDCISLFIEKAIQYPDSDFIIGEIQVEGIDISFPLKINEYQNRNELIASFLNYRWYVMAWNKLIKRDLFFNNNIWFKEGILHEDELFSFNLAMVANVMSAVFQPTYIYKVRQIGSITSMKKYKNFNDLACTYKSNYNYIKNNIHNLKELDFSDYLLTTCFGFVSSVIENRNINREEKRVLINIMLEAFKEVALLCRNLSIKNKLKFYLLKSSEPIVYHMIRIKLN